MTTTEDEVVIRARMVDEMSRTIEELRAELRSLRGEAERVNGTFRDTQGRLRTLDGRFARAGAAADILGGGLRDVDRRAGGASRALDRLAGNANQATRAVIRLTGAVLGLNAAFRGAKGLAGSIAGIQGRTQALILLFATLIPAAVPVAAVLTAAFFASAGAADALIASVGVLALAFSGIGDAVSALASGDLDKINQAFAKLTTQGQDFATFLFSLKPVLDQLRGAAQVALLPQVQEALTQLLTALPAVNNLVVQLSYGLGDVALQLSQALSSPGAIAFLGFIADRSGALSQAAANVISLGSSFAQLAVAFSPFSEIVSGALGGLVDQFAAFSSGATGTLAQFIGYVQQALAPVGEFFKATGKAIFDLLEQLGQPGLVVLGALNQILGVISQLAPLVGQVAQAIGVGLAGVFSALVPVIEQVAPLLGGLLVQAAQLLASTLITLAPTVGQIASFLLTQLGAALTAVAPLLPLLGQAFLGVLAALEPLLPAAVQLLPILGTALLGIFQALTPAVSGLASVLGPIAVQLATALAPVVVLAAQALGQLAAAVVPLLPLLGDAFVQILNAIVPQLPALVAGLVQVVDALVPLTPAVLALVLAFTPLLPPIIQLASAFLPGLAASLQIVTPFLTSMAGALTMILGPAIDSTASLIGTLVGLVDKLAGGFQKIAGSNFLGKIATGAASFLGGGASGGSVGGSFGDTGTRHGVGGLASTMSAHAGLLAGTGGVAISNALIGGGGRGPGSGDHQAGRALDLVGPGVQRYAQAASAAGHFAQMHGSGAGRHLHVAYRAMGDTGVTRAVAPVGAAATTRSGDVFKVDVQVINPTSNVDIRSALTDALPGLRRELHERRSNGAF